MKNVYLSVEIVFKLVILYPRLTCDQVNPKLFRLPHAFYTTAPFSHWLFLLRALARAHASARSPAAAAAARRFKIYQGVLSSYKSVTPYCFRFI